MPWRWLDTTHAAPERSGAAAVPDGEEIGGADEPPPIAALVAWPHQSLTAGGLVLFIGATAAMLSLPLVMVLGSVLMWVLLVPVLGTLAAIWLAIARNRRDRSLREDLAIWPDRIVLVRRDPGQEARRWQADVGWVTLRLTATAGPVPQYLTLRGGGREVELGAFLTEDERRDLFVALDQRLHALREGGTGSPGTGRPG